MLSPPDWAARVRVIAPRVRAVGDRAESLVVDLHGTADRRGQRIDQARTDVGGVRLPTSAQESGSGPLTAMTHVAQVVQDRGLGAREGPRRPDGAEPAPGGLRRHAVGDVRREESRSGRSSARDG